MTESFKKFLFFSQSRKRCLYLRTQDSNKRILLMYSDTEQRTDEQLRGKEHSPSSPPSRRGGHMHGQGVSATGWSWLSASPGGREVTGMGLHGGQAGLQETWEE